MKLDFTTEEEKLAIEEVFDNALTCLNEDDRNLQAIESMKGLLKRGIGIHHSGLLPILKELIEILFQESLLKILFATETFAMGLNMPAKTVIFTAMTKWDGEAMRYMRSGEYIQMSGRAGRRGKDLKGICIMMIDDKMDEATCADMVSGRPLPLLSNYKLTYYTLLNLLRKPDGTTEQKKTIERSFHQYQHQSSVPELQKEIEALTEEDGAIKINVSMENLSQKAKDLLELQNMRQAIINSLLESGDSCFSFLCAGRLVHIVDGTGDWGWGIIVSVFKKVEKDGKDEGHGGSTSDQYIIDVMLPCRRRNDAAGGGCIEPLPSGTSSNKEDTDILVVPVSCSCLAEISSLRVGLPKVLNDASGKRKVQTTILSVIKKYQNGNLPLLHPSRDLGLQDQDDLWFEINNLKLRTLKYRGSSSSIEKVQYSQVAGHKRKMDIKKRVKQLEEKIKDSQVTVFNREIKLRSAVLKRLGHIDESGVLTNKGRAACEVDTADELMASELMLEGAFNSLNIHQVVAVASCLVPVERSQAQVELKPALKQPLQVLRDTAKHIATVSEECKLEIDIEEYVESFKPTLMNVTYHWSKGTSFSDICDMTDVFEGSIIRAMRRLNELLGQMENAASAIGDEDLAKKFGEASASIQRGIIFAASLYI
jgi:ATP-dependent RNA helicase DOB1